MTTLINYLRLTLNNQIIYSIVLFILAGEYKRKYNNYPRTSLYSINLNKNDNKKNI